MEIWRGIKREIFQRGKNKMGLCKRGNKGDERVLELLNQDLGYEWID